jgi:predicted 2-oxoglutarate/Fe(II)-dependent dioxygenase YbiX
MNLAQALIDVGLARIPEFLDRDTCAALIRQVRGSASSEACGFINLDTMTVEFDPRTRKGSEVKVDEHANALVATRAESVRPILAARFRKTLTRLQSSQFMAYAPGDFYAFHRDTEGKRGEPDDVLARKLSWVIFLNDEAESASEGAYQGGALQFYAHDIVPDGAFAETAISIHGRAGLFVAFDPRVLHRVQPVVAGNRYTIVGGFE